DPVSVSDCRDPSTTHRLSLRKADASLRMTHEGYDCRPTSSANSRHFQAHSTSSNPISRNHLSWVSTSNNLFDGSSVSTVNPIRSRNSWCSRGVGEATCSRLQNTPPGLSSP